MAGTWRAMGRLLRMLGHTWSALRIARKGFEQWDAASQQRFIERWAQNFLQQAGVTLQVHGQPLTTGPVLWAANHQSWLDIPTLHAAHYCRFVAKAEIAQWPGVGRLARAAGTLFIQRSSRRDTQRTVHTMAQSLRSGDILAVFPEGTVGDGRSLLTFHGNTLQAAIDTDTPVQAVALTFVDARTGLPSYVPCEAYLDEPMWRSLWRTLQAEHLVAVVRYGTPAYAQGRDRRAWAQEIQADVQALRALTHATDQPSVKP